MTSSIVTQFSSLPPNGFICARLVARWSELRGMPSKSIYVFERGQNHAVADAVLAMVRTYTIGQAAHFSQ